MDLVLLYITMDFLKNLKIERNFFFTLSPVVRYCKKFHHKSKKLTRMNTNTYKINIIKSTCSL